MELETILYAIGAFVHANLTLVSVATIVVVLLTLGGDALDLAIFAMDKGWRALLSFNVILQVLGEDPANATAAGAAALAFFATLGAGGSARDAAVAAIAAIGTVNTGYLFGADRAKIAKVFGALLTRLRAKPAPA